MLTEQQALIFAKDWIDSWNSHDLDRILDHYSDDFEITTPMIKTFLKIDTGTLKGKQNIKEYWSAALKVLPDMTLELVDVVISINSIALYYKTVMEKMAIEVIFFDSSGKINKAIAHYTLDAQAE